MSQVAGPTTKILGTRATKAQLGTVIKKTKTRAIQTANAESELDLNVFKVDRSPKFLTSGATTFKSSNILPSKRKPSLKSTKIVSAPKKIRRWVLLDPPKKHQLIKKNNNKERRSRCKSNNRKFSLVHASKVKSKSVTQKINSDDSKPMLRSDARIFQGKIVFNLDGGSFVIDTENSKQDSTANAATATSKAASTLPSSSEITAKIEKVTKIKEKLHKYSGCYVNKANKAFEKKISINNGTNPVIHSFRIVSAKDIATNVAASIRVISDKGSDIEGLQKSITKDEHKINETEDNISGDENIVQCFGSETQQPILMCFICKLSFGNTKSFSFHAISEHQLTFQSKEHHLLNQEYSSAIIQPTCMDQSPQISFLEPLEMLNVLENDKISNENVVGSSDKITMLKSAVEQTMHNDNEVTEVDDDIAVVSKPLSESSLVRSCVSPELSSQTVLTKSTAAQITTVSTSSQISGKSNPICALAGSNNDNLLAENRAGVCQKQQYEIVGLLEGSSKITTVTTLPALNTKFHHNVTKLQHEQRKHEIEVLNMNTITNVNKSSVLNTIGTKGKPTLDTLASENITKSLPTKQIIEGLDKIYTSRAVESNSEALDATDSSRKLRQVLCKTNALSSVDSTDNPKNIGHHETTPLFKETKEEDNPTVNSAVDFGHSFFGQEYPPTRSDGAFLIPSSSRMCIAATAVNNLGCLQSSISGLTEKINPVYSTTEETKNSAKLLTDLLQQHLSIQQQRQQQLCTKESLNFSDILDYKGDGFKNLEIQQPQTSPQQASYHDTVATSNHTASQFSQTLRSNSCKNSIIKQLPGNLIISSNTTTANVSAEAQDASAVTNASHDVTLPTTDMITTATVSVTNNTPTFTIGACSDHISGRLLGIECSRCEMILNTTRLNTGTQISSRNSCKTLKCPKCNWHYKYQETLEIHMREKHPDGESACGYCLSDNYKLVNVSAMSVPGSFSISSTIENSPFNIAVLDQNSCSPSPNSSNASDNASSHSKSCERVTTPNFSTTFGDSDAMAVVTSSAENIPPVIFKCNNCDFFAQSKYNMELHLGTIHPQTEPDYISIPTNSVAMHAFQAAVAAATAAASAVTATCSAKNQTNFEKDTVDNDCPTLVKRERLYSPGNEFANKSKVSPRNSSTNTPWATVSMTTKNSLPPQLHNKSSNCNVLDEPEDIDKTAKSMANVVCTLCTDTFDNKSSLETHLMNTHCVNRDGLARFLQLVDTCMWQHLFTNSRVDINTINGNNTLIEHTKTIPIKEEVGTSSSTEDDSISVTADLSISQTQPLEATKINETLSCEHCSAQFKHEQELLQHVQNMQHFIVLPNGDHRCLAASHPSRPCLSLFPTKTAVISHYKSAHISLVISERHVYKYRCKHCSLAFKTQEKLSTHFLYHTMRNATKCTTCQSSFRSTHALQKHIELSHCTQNTEEHCSSSDLNGLESENIRILQNQIKSQSSDLCSVVTATNQESNARQLMHTSAKNKNLNDSTHEPTLPINILQNQQQKSPAGIKAVLLNQATVQQQCRNEELPTADSKATTQLMKPIQINHSVPLLTQAYLSQQQQIPEQKALPQLTASGSDVNASTLNAIEILNLMQFHHIMSMNFMNLAPPLIFGADRNEAETDGSVGLLTSSKANTDPLNGRNNTRLSNDIIAQDTHTAVGAAEAIINTVQLQEERQKQCAIPNISQMTNNQKRARTRITDEQLKILRAHFDINNSPGEESIMEMSQKANLPMKVVKHWFRNTLFKERQRNKDSPYNFNNPPSTTLNLEEYERTGQATVVPLSEDLHLGSLNLTMKQNQQKQKLHDSNTEVAVSKQNASIKSHSPIVIDSPILIDIKTELLEERFESSNVERRHTQQHEGDEGKDKHFLNPASELTAYDHQKQKAIEISGEAMGTASVESIFQQKQGTQKQTNQGMQIHLQQQHINLYTYESKSESGSSDIVSRPQSPNGSLVVQPHYANINELLNKKLDSLPVSQNFGAINLHGNNMGPPKNFQSNKSFEKNSPSLQFDTNSNSSNASSMSSGKRANRTRFTDYQIKVLQEFFENNSYPKDSDLEYLSKLLLLSPRVIVVWFQNARQKQRKIYENQPNNSLYETEEKKHNINYTCKKCNLAFQRYYELIRHQKNHCFKEENNKKSAKAQMAAAKIAQNISSEDSNSSIDINSSMQQKQGQHIALNASAAGAKDVFNISQHSPDFAISGTMALNNTSPQLMYSKSSLSMTDFSSSSSPTPPCQLRDLSDTAEIQLQRSNAEHKLECSKCNTQFNNFEDFREHQLLHLVNTGLFTTELPNVPNIYESFSSILQSFQPGINATHHPQYQQYLVQQQGTPPAKKIRNYVAPPNVADLSSIADRISSVSNTKRYNFLYQYFLQNENNNEAKQSFHAQQQQSNQPDLEIDFLANFYNQCELRKRNSYDYLYQYYQESMRHHPMDVSHIWGGVSSGEIRPHMEFLLQFYQLNESKKFYLLNASNNPTNDGTVALQEPNVRCTNTPLNKDEKSNSPMGNIVSSTPESSKIRTDKLSICNNTPLHTFNDHIDNEDIDEENKIGINSNRINVISPDHCVDDTEQIFGTTQKYDESYCSKERHTTTPTMGLNIEGIVLNAECKATSSSSSPSLMAKSHLRISRKPTDVTSPTETKNSVNNFNKFIDSRHVDTPTTLLDSNIILSKQGSTDGSGCFVTRVATPSLSPNSNSNRNSVAEDVDTELKMDAEKQQNKRLRTTILPDQLNFLYECYQNQSNPSRKMLEEIAKKVNLKKRVVQIFIIDTQSTNLLKNKGGIKN
ncbi:zinc finger protein 2 isoform X2 [Eurosta solidaginis]|uniref:zinc finger protein 2 isoform X2 n=1 Tax=Eurosta solidaginis TaxID=178769 RepID=UPI0035310908